MPATHERRARENLGTFTWCAHFDHERGRVARLRSQSARRVKAGDSNGLSDPYVVVTLHRVNESKERLAGIVRAEEQLRRDGVEDEEDTGEGERGGLAPTIFSRLLLANERRATDENGASNARSRVERTVHVHARRSRSDSYLTFELSAPRAWAGEDDFLSQTAIRVRGARRRETDGRARGGRETPWRQIPSKLEPAGALNVVAYFEDDERTDLRVCVKRADDVSAGDVFGTSDVFVEATCGETTFRTKVCENTTSPVWDHWLRFEVTGRETSREERRSRRRASESRARVSTVSRRRANARGRLLGTGASIAPPHAPKRVEADTRGRTGSPSWTPRVEVAVADFRVRARSKTPRRRRVPDVPEEGVIDKAKAFARQTYDATRARARDGR